MVDGGKEYVKAGHDHDHDNHQNQHMASKGELDNSTLRLTILSNNEDGVKPHE